MTNPTTPSTSRSPQSENVGARDVRVERDEGCQYHADDDGVQHTDDDTGQQADADGDDPPGRVGAAEHQRAQFGGCEGRAEAVRANPGDDGRGQGVGQQQRHGDGRQDRHDDDEGGDGAAGVTATAEAQRRAARGGREGDQHRWHQRVREADGERLQPVHAELAPVVELRWLFDAVQHRPQRADDVAKHEQGGHEQETEDEQDPADGYGFHRAVALPWVCYGFLKHRVAPEYTPKTRDAPSVLTYSTPNKYITLREPC